MIAPYDHEALWLKAKVFLNRAMDPDPVRSFDEQAFWASAALELLGKAALARVSPLLIAEPTEEGVNILIATGLIEGTAKFTSVSASTVFKRCQRAFRPFSAADALKFAEARNEYLHGPALGLVTLPPEAWWPRYWALASILVTAQDREIEELVGPDRVSAVGAYLQQNAKNVEHRTESLIARAAQRIAQYRAGNLPARVQMEWQSNPDLTAGLSYSEAETCPACGSTGTLEGDDDSDTSYQYEPGDDEYDPGTTWAEITVPADYFSCPTCHLVLDRYELIEQADLPTTFEVIDDEPPEEPEYGND
jgi:rubredoxin